MRYFWQHIRFIIDNYNGSVPLAHFLKSYLKKHPKLGSRDRKLISDMAYSWYRCEKGIEQAGAGGAIPFENKIKISLELCGLETDLFFLKDVTEVAFHFNIDKIFGFPIQLSAGIEKEEWLASMLVQPLLFIRVRKEKALITGILDKNNIAYSFITPTCLRLPNGTKVETLLPADAYVVQDASSQKTGDYFKPQKNERWYDCCAGAGGKSLLLKDLSPTVQLTVSDLRESILHNLHDRFRLYHHAQPTGKITDIADAAQLAGSMGTHRFDNIICDAPCSGSGTWARTPEQMYFFQPDTLARFSEKQLTIAANVARYLKPNGRMIYITCSVFAAENEQVVLALIRDSGLRLVETQLINGIKTRADSMFVAVLERMG